MRIYLVYRWCTGDGTTCPNCLEYNHAKRRNVLMDIFDSREKAENHITGMVKSGRRKVEDYYIDFREIL